MVEHHEQPVARLRRELQRLVERDVVEGHAHGNHALVRAVGKLRKERAALEADRDRRLARLLEQLAQGRIALALVADENAAQLLAAGQRFLDRMHSVDDVVEVERVFAAWRTRWT